MLERIYWLLEIISLAICISSIYGVKIKADIKTVAWIAIEVMFMGMFKRNLTTIPSAEFDKKLKEILVKSQWIIDGNYQRTLEARMKECDLIILLDLPTKVCLESVKSRIGTKREDMPWVETEETLEGEFKQWIQKFSDKSLPEIYQLLEKYKDKEVVIFKSREEANFYLENL